MSKFRTGVTKPLIRKSSTDPKAKLSSRQEYTHQSNNMIKKNKKESTKDDVVHLHQDAAKPVYMTCPMPWWVNPEDRGLLGGMFPGGPGGPGGMFPGGPGGPGGMFPGGPGGPGGPFPPPPPPPGPGPGPFPPPPPPRPPFPPGPGPFPIPIPIPIPIPGPQPLPPAFITVRIVGGTAFPRVNYTNYIPFYPGITIRQALASTGLVDFGPAGFIRNVAGIPIFGSTEVRLRYQGRVIPQTLLNFPAEPGSIISLELYFSFVDAIPIPL